MSTPPAWLTTPPGGEIVPLMLAAVAATYGAGAIMNMRDDEEKGYALIGTGVVLGVVLYGLKQACGSSKAGFCLLAAG